MSRRAQLRSDSNTLVTSPGKRPRADEDHEASVPKPKARKSNSRAVDSGIVTLDAPGLALAQVPIDEETLAADPHTMLVGNENDTVNPVSKDANLPTPRPSSMGAFTIDKSVKHNDNGDQDATINRQTANQAPKTTPNRTTTSECSNTSAPPDHTAHDNPSESTLSLDSDRIPTHAQPSVPTAAPPRSNLWEDTTRWIPTPYTLRQRQSGDQLYPRLIVHSDNSLCKVIGAGEHPIATAIAKIHQYGHEKAIPREARQALKFFDDINRHYPGSPDISLLDPLLYHSTKHSQAELEIFRRKEWGWLVRAGRPITFPDKLCGSWDLITIQVNYQRLEIALVLSRGNDKMTYLPDPADLPQELGSIQLYEDPPYESWSPVPFLPPKAWQDIAFCHRWINDFTSEDICVTINNGYRQALTPQHIDEIVRATFRGHSQFDCTHSLACVSSMTEYERASHQIRIMKLRLQASKAQYHQLFIAGW